MLVIGFQPEVRTEGGANRRYDQDGTLWVEQPVYSQVIYCFDHFGDLVKEHPELKDRESLKTVLSGDRKAIAQLPLRELFEIVFATQSGMTVERFYSALLARL